MTDFEDIEIKTVEKLDLKDGDVLAVYIKGMPSQSDITYIERRLTEMFLPKIVKVLVINAETVKLQALRTDDNQTG